MELRGLENILGGEVKIDEPMAKHTSFGIGGPVDFWLEPGDIDKMTGAIMYLKGRAIPFVIIGRGTNILVGDKGFRGAVICTNKLNGIERLEGEMVYADAGVNLMRLVSMTGGWGLTGMEFAAGIPGSVGGAVVMNAGARGSDMSSIIKDLIFLDNNGEIEKRSRRGLRFEYRRLFIGEGETVVGVNLSLLSGSGEEIKENIKRNIDWRRERQPINLPSAGSVFKNPTGISAGELIDGVKLKGKVEGKAMISTLHANFIVNTGGARAKDVLTLIELIRREVEKSREIMLEPEIRYLGEDGWQEI